MDSTQHIRVEQRERVQRITIDRPQKKNALTGEMYAAMADAITAAESSDAVRVHYITGVHNVFTAGNDLAAFLNPQDGLQEVLRFLEAIRVAEKPIVIAVNGVAVGVGVTMLLHADLVVASACATFRTPFVDLGLVPEAGSSLLMPARMGYAKAARMLMLGETFDAEQAYLCGLVGEVASRDELEEHAFSCATRLASRAPHALRATKRLMRRAEVARIKETMDTEAALFLERLSSPELVEAVQAFLQKRTPDFSAF